MIHCPSIDDTIHDSVANRVRSLIVSQFSILYVFYNLVRPSTRILEANYSADQVVPLIQL